MKICIIAKYHLNTQKLPKTIFFTQVVEFHQIGSHWLAVKPVITPGILAQPFDCGTMYCKV